MSATLIKAHDELSIEPAPIIPRERIRRDADACNRDVAIWWVASESQPAETYRVVYEYRHRTYHCHCTAATFGNVCKHIRSVVWLRAYDAAWRGYVGMTRRELRERETTFAAMASGRLVPTRAFRAEQSALGDYIGELMGRAA